MGGFQGRVVARSVFSLGFECVGSSKRSSGKKEATVNVIGVAKQLGHTHSGTSEEKAVCEAASL